MLDRTKPMDWGDIFSNTFKLLKETFSKNIVIVTVFLIPFGILLAIAMQTFFSSIAEIAKATSVSRDTMPQEAVSLMYNTLLYFLITIVFSLAFLGAIIGVIITACSSLDGKKLSLTDIFNNIFSMVYIRCAIAVVLVLLTFAGLFFGGMIFSLFTGFIDVILINFLGFLLFFALMLYGVYLFISWNFSLVYIIHKNEFAVDSLKKSHNLIKGNWWRTFGIILLSLVAVNFAVSIITTPISIIFMWDYISHYYKTLAVSPDINKNPQAAFELMKSVGLGFGLNIILSAILQSLIIPLLQVIMYFDLRIRNNEF